MSSITVEVNNCNNIDHAEVNLIENKLNIKFAPNGTGKSTIAKALQLVILDDKTKLNELLPFKLRQSNPNGISPEIRLPGTIKTIMCFNEDYVSQFLYQQKELLANSFDILIRTDEYKKIEKEISELVSSIKKIFSENQDIDNLIATLNEMGNAFKLTKSGLDKKSIGMKGLSVGNKIIHVPVGLEPYTQFIQSRNSVGWIEWQTKGTEFSELSDNCPFCASTAIGKKDLIMRVGQEYDKNIIKNLIAIIGMIEKLGEYFSDEAKAKLTSITQLKDGLGKEHEAYLATVKTQIDNFTEKLEKLKTLSAFQFNEGDKVSEKLPGYKLDFKFFSELQSKKMQESILPLNNSIDELINQAGKLQGKINLQKDSIHKTIERHNTEINDFLSYAGYRYAIEISGEGEQAQLKLRHLDHSEQLTGGKQYLSFGERNAFAIVLFMYECLSRQPDLIILDDPISSFDKNKKYAILEMLFRRDAGKCLKNKTVIMLTHDIEPIIDTIKSLSDKFSNQTSASFLRLAQGIISEHTIEKKDIQTFSQICKNVLSSDKNNIIKAIYLRRYYEIIDNKGDAYQVLSNLLHRGNGKVRGIDIREPKDLEGNFVELCQEKFLNGCNLITEKISDFSYNKVLEDIIDLTRIKELYKSSSNGYEKLQLIRILGINVNCSVVQKFINETYHIENEFICQLDPTKYDVIPEYVIIACDNIINSCN